MKRDFTKILAVALAMVLLVSAPAQAGSSRGTKGSGDMETRKLDLADFHAMELGGAFEIEVEFGDKQKVEVTIDDNLWDLLEAEVHGGTFTLGWNASCRPSDDCKVVITARKLDSLDISGAGDVDISGFHGDRFEFQVSGAADLDIDGEVGELEIQVSGAGDVDARDLKAETAKVRISGAGNAEIYASERFEGRVSGVGNIRYYGDPEDKKVSVYGMGSIKEG